MTKGPSCNSPPHDSLRASTRNGFTLIEMSMVLVIVALVVGGVMVGRDLIEISKMRQLMGQLTQLNTAIFQFKEKFNALPGDYGRATNIWGAVSGSCTTVSGLGTQTCDGNNNGAIDADCCGGAVQWESLRVWQHLQNAGVLNTMLTAGSPHNCSVSGACYLPNINSPATVYGNDTTIMFGTAISSNGITWAGKAETRNAYYLARPLSQFMGGFLGRPHGNFFSGSQAFIFDSKYDDGMPFTGLITNIGNGNYPYCTNSSFTRTSRYDTTSNEYGCSVIVDALR